MKIGVGIDTGGTYTDAVLYDFSTGEVLGKAKSPTTKKDLALGIGRALSALPGQLLCSVEMVSLSTTLATNAVVENVGGRVGLVMIGVDETLLQKVSAEYGLPPVAEILRVDAEVTMRGDIVKAPDWDLFARQFPEWSVGKQAVAIVQYGARGTGAQMEKEARDIVRACSSIPTICGHELHTDLNMMRRAASALLNARLLPVIEGFLASVKAALKQHGIAAPVVIVRSDGTLMSEAFAAQRPVETLLCGPAASVMFGAEVAKGKSSLIVDMGGTTSDIAMVKNGVPVRAHHGVDIGGWKTFVKGMYINTFGLGGDSAVRYGNGRQLSLGPGRLVPLCMLATEFPQILEELKRIAEEGRRHTVMLHEFLLLAKEPEPGAIYNEFETMLCNALREGPLSIEQAVAKTGMDLYNMGTSRLEQEGVVLRSGLTPTDAMHINGDFNGFDAQASRLGARCVAQALEIDEEKLVQRIYEMAKKKLYMELVEMMLAQTKGFKVTAEIRENIALAWETVQGRHTGFARPAYGTAATLVGLGAPIHIFLQDVASALGTGCIVPKHADVANAIGALVGNVSCEYEIHISYSQSDVGVSTYIVHGPSGNAELETLEEAVELAKELAKEAATEEAMRRGACGKLKLKVKTEDQVAYDAMESEIFMGSIVTAQAIGRISV